jgi:hypothetical protein
LLVINIMLRPAMLSLFGMNPKQHLTVLDHS